MPLQAQSSRPDLTAHWLVCGAMLTTLCAYNVACQVWGSEFQMGFAETQRELIRSILYGVAILLFPFTKLLRHILLRLNQTMPGPQSASQRYLFTIVVAQALVELIGLFGLAMFVLGDGFNTLYIFSGMSMLGIFLHKPVADEYVAIALACSSRNLQSL